MTTREKEAIEFERWFIENYKEMFEYSNPLRKGKNGLYKDRGTLGMWIVWQKKEAELSLVRKQRNILIGEIYITHDAIKFEKIVNEIRGVK